MNKYISRLTSSSRGEPFNILSWLFLVPTFFCGLAAVLGTQVGIGGATALITAALNLALPYGAVIWGLFAMFNIVMGATFLLFNFPPFGKASGIIGFMIWIWAGFCFLYANLYLLVAILCIPQAFFWIYQYFILSKFRLEDAIDKKTLDDYDRGRYDDELNPKDSKIDREENRGKDVQSHGSYDNPDNGGDSTRSLDRPDPLV